MFYEHFSDAFFPPSLSGLVKVLFRLLGVNEFAPTNALIQLFDRVACDATMEQLRDEEKEKERGKDWIC